MTIFHKILAGDIPADVVYEDDDVLVFRDIQPKANTHLLLIPKEESFIPSVIEATGDKAHVPGMLIEKARAFAAEKGIEGYKLQFNVGSGGGQEVFYIHLHFLSDDTID